LTTASSISMASTSSPPAYAYVFSDILSKTPLIELDAKDHLSKLHSKYWGVGIDQDESEWVGTHEQLPEIDDSEVVRGCFALNLDISGLMVSKLWVRKDYIRIYDHCDHYYEDIRNKQNQHLASSVVITGQPGCGKSFWILYAIRRRLGEAKPFLWYYFKQWYLFVQGGVFQLPPQWLDFRLFAPYIWAFTDADNSRFDFLSELAEMQSRFFTIFASSPRQDRWKSLAKTTNTRKLIMNPWTWEEMVRAIDIYDLSESHRTSSREAFLQYGPIPRFCINYIEDRPLLDEHESKLQTAISDLTLDSLLSYIRMGERLDIDLSHAIILIRRENLDNLFKFNIEPISPSVNRLMKRRLLEKGQRERLRTYMLHEKVENSRIVLGILFESLAQIQL